jgi:hypothetical protein
MVLHGLLSALLPEDLRRDALRHHGVAPAWWSFLVGIVEAFGGGLLLVDGYLRRLPPIVDAEAARFVTYAEHHAATHDQAQALTWSGAGAWLVWLLSPWTLLLVAAFLTGLTRLVAFATTREAIAEPAVWIGWQLWKAARRPVRVARHSARFGPPRADLVLAQPGGDLLVLTAAPRPEWNDLIAIEVGDRFYRLIDVGERLERGRRWHAHLLRELDGGAVLRGLVRYEPPAAAAGSGPLADRVAHARPTTG